MQARKYAARTWFSGTVEAPQLLQTAKNEGTAARPDYQQITAGASPPREQGSTSAPYERETSRPRCIRNREGAGAKRHVARRGRTGHGRAQCRLGALFDEVIKNLAGKVGHADIHKRLFSIQGAAGQFAF